MAQALALAALGEGTTSPNPRVGCVVVREGRLVGRGYHRVAGGPHAEVIAIAEAGDRARGATLYVNLEPCAHHGRTPPCVDLLVRSGIRRVVAAMRDPNPMVEGQGFDRLREAGVELDVGLLAGEAEQLNESFVHWYRRSRPFVTLKAALSMDGMLSAEHGFSRWITGAAARRFAHRLRLRSDAVLVGAGTVRRDDPRLTVRLAGETRSPMRVVLSGTLRLDPSAQVFEAAATTGGATRVYTADRAAARANRELADRAEIVPVGRTSGGSLDLRAVLQHLAESGVQSLLVEGGGATFASFLRAGLADAGALFYSPKLLGARGATPLFDGPTVARPALGRRLERRCLISLGEDLVVLGSFQGGAKPVAT
jgi:diaminohydroxyphosphoribosylaminopyrimidine deaminase/5-amino-6-(5-phosphoribosylamino)uracil reductase